MQRPPVAVGSEEAQLGCGPWHVATLEELFFGSKEEDEAALRATWWRFGSGKRGAEGTGDVARAPGTLRFASPKASRQGCQGRASSREAPAATAYRQLHGGTA